MIKVRNFQALIDVNYTHNYVPAGMQQMPLDEQSMATNQANDIQNMSMVQNQLNENNQNPFGLDGNQGNILN